MKRDYDQLRDGNERQKVLKSMRKVKESLALKSLSVTTYRTTLKTQLQALEKVNTELDSQLQSQDPSADSAAAPGAEDEFDFGNSDDDGNESS